VSDLGRDPLNKISIEIKDLYKTFDENAALNGISLRVTEGESLTIFGPNGAGKTTLIKILATIMNPSSGSILIDGLSIRDQPDKVRRKLGIVSHNTFLYQNLSAFENLDFYRKLYDIPKERIYEISALIGMQSRLYDNVSTLSRGMQQRFSIARALLHNPSIILLDEPETGLDQEALELLWGILKNGEQKRTIVTATHNLSRGLETSDRVLILVKGGIVYEGQKQKLDINKLTQIYQGHTGGAK